jgi:2-(3-amino-3-carboxypropyl)histidine synthase
LEAQLKARGKEYIIVLLSEIFPAKLTRFKDVGAWIQIACPRLSIDWGYAFSAPLLSPFEAAVVLGEKMWIEKDDYPMDFYANNSGGKYTPNHGRGLRKQRP